MPDNPLRSRDPRSLLPSVAVLAGIVLVAAALHAAQGLFATVAFGALAAVICRRLQLLLLRRGMGSKAAVAVVVTVFVLVIGSLAVAFIASLIALAAEISGESATLTQQFKDLAGSFGLATGLPPDSVPQVDVSTLLVAARSLLGMIGPAVTGLLMAVLIVTYLLIDADGLRARMLRVTLPGIIARYDTLAVELVVYIKVRAVLGGAAAIADVVLLLVLGVPYAVLWGVVSFLFSFVPNIGFVLALIPPTVLAFLDGGIGAAVAVVVGYTAINLAFDYVLQPRMMSTNLDLSPVVVIVSILVWTFVIGAMGALLAMPLTIALRTVLLPYPGARWFVALLGPVPEDAGEPVEAAAEAVAPAVQAAEAVAPAAEAVAPAAEAAVPVAEAAGAVAPVGEAAEAVAPAVEATPG
jgi:AI-2 transport protein TqsA